MQEEKKPIKRSAELTPLSRDHHEGLLLVWKIRQGFRNGTELLRIADYVRWFWKTHLDVHFREEEQLFTPILPQGNEWLQQMLNEHSQLREMANKKEWNETSLESFAQLLNDHIRFEERTLFPFIEQQASPEQLRAIYESHSAEKNNAVWKDEFWLKK
jgi:hemerythrin-like domain-containing protein